MLMSTRGISRMFADDPSNPFLTDCRTGEDGLQGEIKRRDPSPSNMCVPQMCGWRDCSSLKSIVLYACISSA